MDRNVDPTRILIGVRFACEQEPFVFDTDGAHRIKQRLFRYTSTSASRFTQQTIQVSALSRFHDASAVFFASGSYGSETDSTRCQNSGTSFTSNRCFPSDTT